MSAEDYRREFLKLAIPSFLAVLTTCSPVGRPLAVNNPNIRPTPFPEPTSTPDGAPTLTAEQAAIAGKGEFANAKDNSLAQQLTESLSKNFNIKIPDDLAVPFDVQIGKSDFNFVSLPPLQNKERGINWGEKVFMQVGDTLADLDRKEIIVDGKKLVVWFYLNTGTPEAVLWYLNLSEDDWRDLSYEQKKSLSAGFAPPSPIENEIPGFTRNSNQIFEISFNGLPDGALKVSAAPVEVKSVVTIQEGTLTPVDKIPEGLKNVLKKDIAGNWTLDVDGEALPINIFDAEGKVQDISLIAGTDGHHLVGLWEYDKDGKYIGVYKFTVDQYNSKKENPGSFTPTISQDNISLIKKFAEQTNNPNFFKDMAAELSIRLRTKVSEKYITPEMYRFRYKTDTNVGPYIAINPEKDENDLFYFYNILPAQPFCADLNAPMLRIKDIGVRFPVYVLNNNGSVIKTHGVFGDNTMNDFSNVATSLDTKSFSSILLVDKDKFQGEFYNFIREHSKKLLDKYDSKSKIANFDPNDLSDTFFLLYY